MNLLKTNRTNTYNKKKSPAKYASPYIPSKKLENDEYTKTVIISLSNFHHHKKCKNPTPIPPDFPTFFLTSLNKKTDFRILDNTMKYKLIFSFFLLFTCLGFSVLRRKRRFLLELRTMKWR